MRRPVICMMALLLLLSGCEEERAEAPETVQNAPAPISENMAQGGQTMVEQRLYYAYLGREKTLVLDADGDLVRDTGVTCHALRDPETGEVAYYYQERIVDGRAGDLWSYLQAEHCLYDSRGEPLIGWEEKSYIYAFGDYIIRQDPYGFTDNFGIMGSYEHFVSDEYQTALYHVPTGQSVRADVYSVLPLDNGTYILCDKNDAPLGVVDGENREVLGFPLEKPYLWVQVSDGHLLAWDESYEPVLLDEQFTPLDAPANLSQSYCPGSEGYLEYSEGDQRGFFHREKGVVFSVDRAATISYFDGELAIVQGGEGDSGIVLLTVDGQVLRDDFSTLEPAQLSQSRQPAEQFIGVRDSQVLLIDRRGETLFAAEMGADIISVLAEGLYECKVYVDNEYQAALLNSELEVIIPRGYYSGFSPVWDRSNWDATAPATGADGQIMLLASHPSNDSYSSDLLDADGRVLADEISALYDAGDGRVVFQRGYRICMMDFQGNLLAEHSVFQYLMDD